MMFKTVEEFNKEIIGIDRDRPQQLEAKEFEWLIGAFEEEIIELNDARAEGNIVDQIDAIMDLIYFACGGITRMGVKHEMATNIFNIIHEANMQKARGKKEGRAVDFELDASKPEGWQAPEERIRKIMGI
ncbi:MAG: hypothetical protein U9Q91_00240 [Candidatus Marinimicrobia bacterium]|nr:hypothetical protein [Candidatus Neomarinimicrobiota bacterium]